MATENVKNHLFEQTGIAQSQWKRLSKNKNTNGSETRIFQDKSSGKTFETIEFKDGSISIVEKNVEAITPSNKEGNSNNSEVVIDLINKVLSQGKKLTGEEPGYNQIPKYFDFCFLEHANVDHTEALEDAANSLDPKVAVTSFNIFFIPKFPTRSSCMHLSRVLAPFLPNCLGETEEQSFTVNPATMNIYDDERIEGIKNGSIPYIPYDDLVATLKTTGFIYNRKKCMLGKLSK